MALKITSPETKAPSKIIVTADHGGDGVADEGKFAFFGANGESGYFSIQVIPREQFAGFELLSRLEGLGDEAIGVKHFPLAIAVAVGDNPEIRTDQGGIFDITGLDFVLENGLHLGELLRGNGTCTLVGRCGGDDCGIIRLAPEPKTHLVNFDVVVNVVDREL